MSLHNLATVFGPTLLRPSEKESKLPANPSQPISMTDSWSLEVMSQVRGDRPHPAHSAQLHGGGLCYLTLVPASCSHSNYTGAKLQREGLPGAMWLEEREGSFLCSLLGFSGLTSPGTSSGAPRSLAVRGLCHQQGAFSAMSWSCGLSHQALGSGQEDLPPAAVSTPLSRFPPPALPQQVQVLLYFLQLEAIPAPDSKRQSILFSTEV